jgi:hypothetical protein
MRCTSTPARPAPSPEDANAPLGGRRQRGDGGEAAQKASSEARPRAELEIAQAWTTAVSDAIETFASWCEVQVYRNATSKEAARVRHP